MNTDGSFLSVPGALGAGGLFRSSAGFLRGAFAFLIGQNFAFITELYAAMHAM